MPAELSAAAAVFAQEAGVSLAPDAADEVERVCLNAGVAPQDLFCKWEAYAMQHGCAESAPTAAHLAALGAELTRKTSKPTSKPKRPSLTHRAPIIQPAMGVDDFFSSYVDLPDLPIETPAKKPKATVHFDAENDDTMAVDTPAAPSPEAQRASIIVGGAALGGRLDDVILPGDDDEAASAAFASRQGSGKVLAAFNGAPAPRTPSVGPVRTTVLPRYAAATINDPFTYMSDPLGGVAESLRTRLQVVGARILARRTASLDGTEGRATEPAPDAFFTASPNLVLALGRVRVELDGEAGAGRINFSSVVLESEDGNMVKLGLSRLKAAQLPVFLSPGMIVVVEGINTNGRMLEVHAIHDDSCPMPPAVSTPVVEPESSPVARVAVASGPYTLPDNLKYEPLDALLKAILPSEPDVVVLLGPFVDTAHKLVKETLPVDFESLFEARVVSRISDAAARHPATSFVVVPALGDVHHQSVCPQPAFKRGGRVGPGVRFVSNPCALTITDAAKSRAAVLGVSSLPAILDMSSDSLCSDTGDRVRSLVSHMVHQWSFYPQFPASPGVPMDSSHGSRLELPDCGLDALVSPSVLQPFVKGADGDVFAVNPGMAVRGVSGGGAYAEVSLPLHRQVPGLLKPTDRRGVPLNVNSISAQICRL